MECSWLGADGVSSESSGLVTQDGMSCVPQTGHQEIRQTDRFAHGCERFALPPGQSSLLFSRPIALAPGLEAL